VLARSFHVRKNNERALNARSVRNEQNVPNVRSNYDITQIVYH